NTVRVQQITLSVGFLNRGPCVAAKRVILPAFALSPQICIPSDANPVELEALNLKFGRRIFQVKAGPRVIPAVQKPLDGIDVDSHVDRVWFQTLRLRRRDEPEPL